jgi:hypothetical protein
VKSSLPSFTGTRRNLLEQHVVMRVDPRTSRDCVRYSIHDEPISPRPCSNSELVRIEKSDILTIVSGTKIIHD